MTEREYAELMQYLEVRLRRIGLDDVVNRVVAELSDDVGLGPPDQLLLMIDELESEMQLQHHGTARTIERRINELARRSDAPPIEGLWLDLAPPHQNLFGVDAVNLADMPDMSAAVADLVALRRAILEDLGRPSDAV